MFSYKLAGKKIRLIHTDDRYTKLSKGDIGTIRFEFENLDKMCIAVDWQNGSNLSLIEGVDSYEII